MRFLLGMLLAVRGIERTGSRRLPQLLRSDREVAEKLDGHTAQLGHVEVALAELAAGNRREHEALAMIAGEFRRLREEEQALRRRQAESLEVVAVALTRLADGHELQSPVAVSGDADALHAELEAHRTGLAAAHDELHRLREANTRITDELHELRAAHGEARDAHRDTQAQLDTLREAHRDAEAQLAEAREECHKSSRRLASSHAKLRRARQELELARMPWWRRRRAQAAGG